MTELTSRERRFLQILHTVQKKTGNHAQQRTSLIPAEKSAQPIPGSPREICHQVYDFIIQSRIIAPEKDIKQGKRKSIKLNENGLEKLVCAEQEFNSYLLFSHLAAVLPKSSVIYFGKPGTGKTTAPEIIANCLFGIPLQQIRSATIYGNPEMTTSDMLVFTDLAKLINEGKEVIHRREFMKSSIKIIDEVDKMPPGKRTILYQVVDKGYVNYKNRIIVVPPGPLYATANVDDTGNYEIQQSFVDRFDIALTTSETNPAYIGLLDSLRKKQHIPILSQQHLQEGYREIQQITWDKEASAQLTYFLMGLNYCTMGGRSIERKKKGYLREPPGAICADCHYSSEHNICSQTNEGVSTRTYLAINKFAKAFAWWLGKSQVGISELQIVLPYTLTHKLTPTTNAQDPIYRNDRVAFVEDLFDTSRRSFESDAQIVPVLPDLGDAVFQFYVNNNPMLSSNEIDAIIKDELPKLNSPVKFGLAIALYDIRGKNV